MHNFKILFTWILWRTGDQIYFCAIRIINSNISYDLYTIFLFPYFLGATGGSGMTNAQDPRYEKYFRLLKNGVPLAAVQQKMMFEGYSPDVLSNPDGPSDFKGTL